MDYFEFTYLKFELKINVFFNIFHVFYVRNGKKNTGIFNKNFKFVKKVNT
jgi:hypothetical protein